MGPIARVKIREDEKSCKNKAVGLMNLKTGMRLGNLFLYFDLAPTSQNGMKSDSFSNYCSDE